MLFDFYGAREDSALFVAEAGGVIAGTAGATVFPGTPATGWVHGIVVDSHGAVYAADTYGQRLQKFVPPGVSATQ